MGNLLSKLLASAYSMIKTIYSAVSPPFLFFEGANYFYLNFKRKGNQLRADT